MAARSTQKVLRRGCGAFAAVIFALAAIVTGIVWFQARRAPDGSPEYVALGSSFAAGAGLGRLQDGSPWLCARSTGGYPQLLARKLEIPIVDMSCGGARTVHLLRGGQFFQGPQIRAVTPRTRLVTITAGGNDIAYAGDLSLLAARRSDTLIGAATRAFWSGPRPAAARDYAAVQNELRALLREIRQRAPQATLVVATYPTILPPKGTCARIGLSEGEAALMRSVGSRLAAATRAAAFEEGALLVDMHTLGARHHACSSEPWTNGWTALSKAPFHPNRAGAAATAAAIAAALKTHQQV